MEQFSNATRQGLSRKLFRMAGIATKALSVIAATLVFTTSHASASTITQSVSFNPTYATGWGEKIVSSISLTNGPREVTALTAVASVQDQGWGGHSYGGNDLRLGLYDGATRVWNTHIAGAGRAGLNPINQTYDISSYPSALQGLNAALLAISWSPTSDVQLKTFTSGYGYPGWSIRVNSGSMTVSSVAAVPVPAGAVLILSGFGLFGAARWRTKPAA